MENNGVKMPITLTDRMRGWFKWVVDPVAKFFLKLGLTPNTMTILGLAGNFLAAYFLSQGKMSIGGLIMLIMTPIDALDGTMARMLGEPNAFGAFVDAVSDRYSELALFGGLMYYYVIQMETLGAVLAFSASVGSVMVSYVRARAESNGYEAKVGIMTRVERYLVLAPLLVFNKPIIALWILAILANFTAFHRIWFVRRQAHEQMKAG